MSKKEIFCPDVTRIRILGWPSGCGWSEISKAELRKIKTAQSIAVEYDRVSADGTRREVGCLFTCWRPPRRRDENPIQYYKRTKCVDDRHLDRHKGWYYCNPAYSRRRFRSKLERDKFMGIAYAILSD